MSEDGYRKYREFFDAPTLCTIEWHDTETDAIGWLVVNSLRGGAAGGGTRMRKNGTQEECKFLAKTMDLKLGVSGPPIGGAKSVIKFDHHDTRKADVLRRWFTHIGPYLNTWYGTGGDLNVNERTEVIPLIREMLGVVHPQHGVLVGHFGHTGETCRKILRQLDIGANIPVPTEAGNFPAASLITGYGLAVALDSFYALRGGRLSQKRVLLEGFGEVGGSAAYYLSKAGANVVGILTKSRDQYRWAIDDSGLDVIELLRRRKQGQLPSFYAQCEEGISAEEFWSHEADIFVPAAGSHLTTPDILDHLLKAHVKVVVCGANNPFGPENPFERQMETLIQADKCFSVIPDFIANCGTARLYSYLMEEVRADDAISYAAICDAIKKTIRGAVRQLLGGFDGNHGLLNRAHSQFVQ